MLFMYARTRYARSSTYSSVGPSPSPSLPPFLIPLSNQYQQLSVMYCSPASKCPEVSYIDETVYARDPELRKHILKMVGNCWKIRNSGGKVVEIRYMALL